MVTPPDPVAVRDDLRALEGYHSTQVDVEVRLNTNESPFPPPAAWQDELATAMAGIDWHRYPDREATELRTAIADWHGVRPDQVFAANGSNEVLQTLLLTYAGPGRTVVTFEPTYQLHAHIARITGATVVEGERAADFTLDAVEARRVVESARPAVTFLCSPNNPTGLVEDPSMVAVAARRGAGAGRGRRGLRPVRRLDRARPRARGPSARASCARSPRRGAWPAPASATSSAPSWVVADLDKVVLPYHLDAAKQVAGRLALGHVDEMDDRVKQIVVERERVVDALGRLPVDVFPSGANFVLFRVRHRPPAAGRSATTCGRASSTAACSCATARGGRGWTDCLRVTIGTPAENDRFLAALTEVLAS